MSERFALPDARNITLRAVGDIASSSSESELAGVIQHHLSRLGFLGFTCSSFRSAGALCVHEVEFSTMPPDFVEAFVGSRLLPHDPVTHRARREEAPFFWDQDVYDLLHEPHRRIDRMRRDLGVRGGGCAMIGERFGANGSGGMLLNASGSSFRPTASTLTALQVIAGQIFWKLGMLRTVRPTIPETAAAPVFPALTDRERAVLSWVAAGKSSWEIGRILAISEHTVNSHIERAVAKLDAANRAEAVAKALMLDLIEAGARMAAPLPAS